MDVNLKIHILYFYFLKQLAITLESNFFTLLTVSAFHYNRN